MSNSKNQGFYSLVRDDESETTAIGSVDSFEKTRLQSRPSDLADQPSWSAAARRSERLVWLRWAVVVLLQTAIVALLALRPAGQQPATEVEQPATEVETGGDINGLYPTCECSSSPTPSLCRSELTFTVGHDYRRLKFEDDFYMPNMTSNEDRMEVRRRWDHLMPRMCQFSP